jgi:hypothetical protein
MCGGGSSTPNYTYTQQEADIGVGLKHIMHFRDTTLYKQSVKDTYLDENACCWNDPYKHSLKDADGDESNLTIGVNNPIREKALRLLEERREYMQSKAKKAQKIQPAGQQKPHSAM